MTKKELAERIDALESRIAALEARPQWVYTQVPTTRWGTTSGSNTETWTYCVDCKFTHAIGKHGYTVTIENN